MENTRARRHPSVFEGNHGGTMVAPTLLFLKEIRARRVAMPADAEPSFSSGKSARALLFLEET